jgi:hypothetical protein
VLGEEAHAALGDVAEGGVDQAQNDEGFAGMSGNQLADGGKESGSGGDGLGRDGFGRENGLGKHERFGFVVRGYFAGSTVMATGWVLAALAAV